MEDFQQRRRTGSARTTLGIGQSAGPAKDIGAGLLVLAATDHPHFGGNESLRLLQECRAVGRSIIVVGGRSIATITATKESRHGNEFVSSGGASINFCLLRAVCCQEVYGIFLVGFFLGCHSDCWRKLVSINGQWCQQLLNLNRVSTVLPIYARRRSHRLLITWKGNTCK